MGIGASVSTAVSEKTAVIIEDYMFDASTAGELQPEASPSDFHDAWDLDGTDFTPEASPDDEGYWQDGSNLVTNGTYDELGSELVTNGDFAGVADDTDVTTLTNWNAYGSPTSRNVVDNKLVIVATGGNQGAYYSLGSLTGTYKLSVDVTGDVGAGGIYISSASSHNVTTSVGTVEFTFVASGSTQIFFRAANNNAGTTSYTNISLKQVDPNDRWTLSNTTISDDVLNFPDNSSAAKYAVHTNTSMMDIGSAYEITLNVNKTGGGVLKVLSGTGASDLTPAVSISSSGLQTFIVTNNTNGSKLFLYTTAGENFQGTVDDVSVREYAITPLDV